MGCKLCKKNGPLRNSHIFPEWFYRPLYDCNHQFNLISTNSNKDRGKRPKGIYQKLLCDECEQKLSNWERYARDVFHCLLLKVFDDDYKFTFSSVEYTPFKLFQMSLIWRASITTRPEIHPVDLGTHTEKIRKMLLDESPGEIYEYGTILMLSPVSQTLMQRFLYPPEKVPGRVSGHSAYRAGFGGLFWLFIVSSHSRHIPHELFLSKNGNLPVFKVGAPAVRFMQQLATDFFKAGMLNNRK